MLISPSYISTKVITISDSDITPGSKIPLSNYGLSNKLNLFGCLGQVILQTQGKNGTLKLYDGDSANPFFQFNVGSSLNAGFQKWCSYTCFIQEKSCKKISNGITLEVVTNDTDVNGVVMTVIYQ
tara:strand:- start:216 stop:590 length:375 start_codon:yes stop_codon:yes gene_type:complete